LTFPFVFYRLTEDWKQQRWFTIRHKKQSGPKRVPYNNMNKLKNEYRTEFFSWFVLGSLASVPIAFRIGNRMQSFKGGVPKVPCNRIVDEHFEVQPWKTARKQFKRFSILTMAVSGYCLAHYMTEHGRF
jgi:hypothetical protein|tara:strand:- start:389 stop:775 length:387 start_codon:yes stop_codon:yes gene_type:complete